MKLSRSLILFAACLFSLYAPYTLQASFLARTRQAIANSLSTISKPSIAQSTFRASLQSFMQSSSLSSSWNRCKTLSTNLFSQPMLASTNKSFFNQSTAQDALSNPFLKQHNNNNYHQNNQNKYSAGKQYVKNDIITGLVATGIFVGMFVIIDYWSAPTKYFYGPTVKDDKPVTIFAHGLRQNQQTGYKFYHKEKALNGFIESPLVTFNFNYHDDEYKSTLGQGTDMKTLYQACRSYNEVDAVGVSCGATTLFNYLSSYQPKNIKSAVIEAAFESPYSVLDAIEEKAREQLSPGLRAASTIFTCIKLGFLLFSPSSRSSHSGPYKDRVERYFPNFDRKGILSINVADKIPKEIPLLLVCSAQDDITKNSNSIALFNKTRSAGHNKVYLLNLQHGQHAHILESQDGITYRNVVHAFYRHHKRPYNKAWADAGQKRFEQCPGFAAKA